MADWFRWWHGTVTDNKFLWVCRRAGQRRGDVGMVWCALLEHASQAEDRGSIAGFDAESMDCALDVEDGSTQKIIDAFMAKGMIDSDGRLTGWDRRQPKREDSGGDDGGPMSNTERSKLHRANKRIEDLERQLSELLQRDATQCNAVQQDATHATARVEESRGESTNPLSVVERVGTPEGEASEKPPTGTRKGLVCGLLRKAGMADAAPHYLTDEVWEQILSKRTDEEIVEVAKAKMAARPGQRTGLKYIAPALLEDPQPIQANARASPGRMSQAEQSKLAAARAIFGTEIEGVQHEQSGRIIDVTPTPTPAIGR